MVEVGRRYRYVPHLLLHGLCRPPFTVRSARIPQLRYSSTLVHISLEAIGRRIRYVPHELLVVEVSFTEATNSTYIRSLTPRVDGRRLRYVPFYSWGGNISVAEGTMPSRDEGLKLSCVQGVSPVVGVFQAPPSGSALFARCWGLARPPAPPGSGPLRSSGYYHLVYSRWGAR